ncbi:peptide ABC transporter substrate-binding protein [Lachnospiraceae bacterium C1.1]|nr:peptide ABC transporter substrate-binding protein [Lachnospiraceae bacterium C1.1]
MKKLLAILLTGAMTFSLLSGCGSSSGSSAASESASTVSESNKLRVCLASEPDHLDPALNATVDGAALASNSFVGLYTYNESGEIVPALASDMQTSDDGLTYTITLKDDLKWSDGSDLTAADFEYSWKRAADPQTAADYAYLLDVFAKNADGTIAVSASDDGKSLTCTLESPCPYFMSLLAFPVFMPVKQEAVESASDWQTNPGSWASEAGFVTNGAFTLAEWKHNESMVYVKNPYFYDADNVKLEELDFMLSADDTAKLAAYNAGDLDYIDPLPNDELANLKDSEEFHVLEEIGTYYVVFNVNSSIFDGKTPEQASNMRKAMGYLVDRQTVVDNIGQTGQTPANAFIPETMSDGNGGIFKTSDDAYTYPDEASNGYYPIEVNIEKAVELLKEAGYEFDANNMLSADTPIHMNYLTNDTTQHLAVAQQLQQDFAQIGITMDIQTEDWQTFINDRNNANYDVCRGGWIADYDDPINMLEIFVPNEADSGNDHPMLGFNPTEAAPDWTEYMSLIKEIKADADLADREAKMHQAEDMLMDTGAVVPIYFYNEAYLQKANVTGAYANVFGTRYFLYASKS